MLPSAASKFVNVNVSVDVKTSTAPAVCALAVMLTPPVPLSFMNIPPDVLLVALIVVASISILSSAPVAPMPVTAFNVTKPPVISVTRRLSPSVIAPVRAVKVALLATASNPVTTIDPPTIVILSLNVTASTSTAPVPSVLRPIVIPLNPSVKLPISVAVKLKAPVGVAPPMPIP